MKEITIVTAFFNINRSEWDKFSRTSEQYVEYFSHWAKMKNKLIVYVESEDLAKEVLKIRKEFGLEDKTIVNIVSNYLEIDTELYNSIKNVCTNKIQQEFRLLPKNPESWNYDYNYIMLLKMWCVKDAVEKGQAEGMVAWVDFGYNHGGNRIDSSSDFNFLWKYDFADKINLFSIQDLDDRPIFDIVRSMDVYIMGTIIVGIDYLWGEFWDLMKRAMMSLNYSGLCDDDQTILLMAYRMKPEIFEIYKSGWMLQIKQFGGEHLIEKVEKMPNRLSIVERLKQTKLRKIVRKLKDTKINFEYSINVFKTLQNITRN